MSTVRPRRTIPRRRTAPRWDRADWDTANYLLLRRCHERCEHCGVDLNRSGVERHHRQRRTVGGDRIANLLMLCPPSHQWITEHPAEALDAGWVVSSYADDPATVPVRLHGYGPALLADDGTRQPVP